MDAQTEKRPPFMAAAVLAAVMLILAGGTLALLLAKQPAEQSALLAQKDGYSVLRGAPEGTGAAVAVSRAELLRGTLVLCSPRHPLPADFPAPNTRDVRALVGGYLPAAEHTLLRADVIYALCALQAGHSISAGVLLENGAISAAQQEEMRREAFLRYAKVYPLRQAREKACAAVPGGGESEHQTGLAVDLTLTAPLFLGSSDPLRRTEEGQWLAEHLWEYGFIRRYAPGSREEGACEQLHIRYVGKEHAAAMHALGLGLEDYWALLRTEGKLTLLRGEEPAAYLYCLPCADSLSLPLPENAHAAFSADNTGWAVALIKY